MEGVGLLPARESRATTPRYARCPPSRNHVRLEIKEFAARFHAILIQRRETSHAISLNAAASRRGGQRRVRSWRIQRQRHGTNSGDHGGAHRNKVAGDRAGEPRRASLLAGPIPVSPDDCGHRSLSGASHRAAPGSWQQPGDVQERDRHGLHQRDDGWFADGRRQDTGQFRVQRESDARSGGICARQGCHGGRRNRLSGRDRRRPRRAQAPQSYVRVVQGQPLSTADVKALAKAGVSDDIIITQIQGSHTVFSLSSADIIDLHNSGVSDRVVNFMIDTRNSAGVAQPTATVVEEAPPAPLAETVVVERPGPDYAWVGGEWVWNGRWFWRAGYWAYHPGGIWMEGGWHRGPRGWYHEPGRWRRGFS